MKYLCLIYQNEAKIEALAEGAMTSLIVRHLELNEELAVAGQLLECSSLEPSASGVRIRVRDGRPSVIDGPYAETKEVVAGFYLIEARDLNEAMQVAARFPSAPLGWVEVRPCRDLSRYEAARAATTRLPT